MSSLAFGMPAATAIDKLCYSAKINVDILSILWTIMSMTLSYADVLSALGPEGVFINVGRGTVVDEEALIDALRTGTIAAAGLDVIADEPNVSDDMLALENLTILPHIGSASVATHTAMADLPARNLLARFQSGAAMTPVP
ncbi:D-isomer specific 2-hydroxyacid dehydrogenase-like protein [Chelatococcus asaccharovorans]|uniref:D-isomer specific 2-hydroxyacid dehydrogenase-like protein n=1 Tax=Chelatococcus asaccharovorans TaxID=28210 RepID=A0A2V3TX23_9HYPH|nr:D-isomer specific 2-hydroxyacid dehydrogenase-like protein [Chelatococcus asaccharovorans]